MKFSFRIQQAFGLLALMIILQWPDQVRAQFSYANNGDGTATITGYSGPGGTVTIPTNINGLAVSGIGFQAFYANASLTNVTIPNSVRSVGDSAFCFCGNLTNVTVSTNLTSIGFQMFYGCSKLVNVVVPGGASSLTSIGQNAFCYCTSLSGFAMPASVTNLGIQAFFSCSSLTNMVISTNTTSLSDRAFYSCVGLTSVTIPNAVSSVGDSAFCYCGSLTNVILSTNLATVGFQMFYGCTNLDNVTIPVGVTSIGQNAFCYCTSLKSAVIPNSVQNLGIQAFFGCSSLTSVKIPASVTGMALRAFSSCDALTSVYFQGPPPTPTNDVSVFASDATNIVAYYVSGIPGWGTTYDGIPTMATSLVLTNGLVAYYPLNGNASDASGNGYDGTNYNVTFTTNHLGQASGAGQFNGASAYIELPNALTTILSGTNPMTVSVWEQTSSIGANSGNRDLVQIGSGGLGQMFGLLVESGSFSFNAYGLPNVVSGYGLGDNAWHHCVASYDGAVMSLYVDGVLMTNNNVGVLNRGATRGVIGTRVDLALYECWSGNVGDVLIYNRGLSSNEVSQIYANGAFAGGSLNKSATAPPGIVSWWPGEGNGHDVVGTNNAALQSGVTFTAGEVGQAFLLTNISTYLFVPASPSLNVGLGAGFTLEAWINQADVNGWHTIVEWNNEITQSVGVQLCIGFGQGSRGQLAMGIFDTNGANSFVVSSPTGALLPNVWQHIALTYDRGSHLISLYVNGSTVAQSVWSGDVPQTSYNMWIGHRPSGGWPGSAYLTGALDELSLYNRALTSNEIAGIYNAGSAGKAQPVSAPAVPQILSVAPSSGAPSTLVTISGRHFSPIAASNIVNFGSVQTAVISASATNLLVAVPSGATYAPVTVTVNGLTAYSPQSFLPTFNGGGTLSSSSFGTRLDLLAGNGPQQAVIADVDGDGKPDIIVPNDYDNTIWIYRNIGTNATLTAGSFAAPVILNTLGAPYGLVVADVDGDGKPDLIVTESSANVVSVYRNISTPGSLSAGSFAARVDFATGAYPQGVAVRDIDGDGRPDILVANFTDGTLSVLRNISEPGSLTTNSFAPKVDFATGSGCCNISVGDLDGDGLPDVVTANSLNNTVSILRNTSVSGSIAFASQVTLSSGTYPAHVKLMDLDGDGKLDLAVAYYLSDSLSVFRNISTPGSLTADSFSANTDFALGGRGHTIAVGDLNGDGKPDLAVATELNSMVSVFQNTGSLGSFTNTSLAARIDLGTGWNAWGVTLGDLDGDGRPDMVFCNEYNNTISIYQNQVSFGSAAVAAPSGLVAWWPGEGNAIDVVNGNNGTPVGALNYGSGVVGQGFVLDGSSSYISVPASASLDVGANGTGLTIEAWIKPTDSNEQGPVIEWDSNWSDGVQLWVQQPMMLYANVEDASGIGHSFYTGSSAVLPGVWQHVALTYDKASGAALLYINGAVVATNNFGSIIPQTSWPLNIGRRTGQPVGLNDTFNGGIDELSLYNRALSGSEIAGIYHAASAGKVYVATVPVIQSQPVSQSAPAGGSAGFSVTVGGAAPLAYQWSFNGTNLINATNAALSLANVQLANVGGYSVVVTNGYGRVTSSVAWLSVPVTNGLLNGLLAYYPLEDSGPTVSDIWNGNTGYPYGTLNYQQPGALGYGLGCSSNGALGGVTCSNVYSSAGTNFSVSFWLNSDANYPGTLQTFPLNEASPGYRGWYICTDGADGLYFQYMTGSGYSSYLNIPGCLDTTWHHVVCVKSDRVLSVYRDGICFGSVTNTVDMAPSLNPLVMAINDSNLGGYIYHGLLDEVGVWGRALNSAEVSELYSKLPFSSWANPVVPLVSNQPTNATVVQGTTATFSVTAVGDGPLNYQWLFNSTNLPNATNATLALANVQPAQAGPYAVVITNGAGSATSSVATLTVVLPPAITSQPTGQTAVCGSTVALTVGVAGTAPLTEQWYFNGAPLNGVTGTNLTLTGVVTNHSGNYSVVVVNPYGSVTSSVVTLTVSKAPAAVNLGNLLQTYDGTAKSATAATTPTNLAVVLTYNGAIAVPTNAGLYTVVGAVVDSNYVGSATNTLFVAKASAGIVLSNLLQTYDGSPKAVTYATSPSGLLVALTYNGSPNPPVAVGTYSVSGVVLNANYSGTVSNQLTIAAVAPAITQQPVSQALISGSNVTLSVTATGAPLYYQWLKNGTNVSGATAPTLALNPAAVNNAGVYSVVVSNPAGTVVSSNAVLSVRLPGAPLIHVDGQLAVGTCSKTGSAVVTMDGSFAGGIIFYTLDGTTPSIASQAYGSPLTVTNSVVVRAMGFDFNDSLDQVEAPAVAINILPTYGLTLTTNGSGTILASPAGGNYVSNTVVTLTASAAPGWQFAHWSGDLTGTNNPGTVTVNGSRTVQAVFVQVAYPVTATNLGGGTVALNPALANYPSNTVVTATATASNGWTFLNWSGDASGSSASVNVTVNGAKNVSAIFGTTVHTNVIGAGTIELNVSNTVPYGTVVRATGIPNSGSYFSQWALALTGTNNPAEFAVTSTNPVRALFVTLPGGSVALTTRISGPGDVAVSPAKQYYTAGESVTLTATSRGGTNQFGGWTGDFTGTNNPLVLTLNTSKILTAGFITRVLTPVVNSSLSVTGLTGSAFSYQITAANNATGYAASGLPLGLSVNTTNGLISGTPQSAGVYGVTLYASNAGGTASSTLVLTINAPVYAPSIVQSPSDQTVGTGASAAFSVLANGTGPLGYQWIQNGVTIPSGTNASYNIASVVAGNAGTYQVVVTNLYGSATSSVAHLAIYDAPATRIYLSGSNGVSGQTVTVSVLMLALGKENAASFSLNFDPALFSYQGAQLGSNAQSAGLLVNTNNLGAGQLGLGLVLPAGNVFAAGTRQMAQLQFGLNPVAAATSGAFNFGDQPTARLVADTNANALTATFQMGSLTVTPGQYCGDLYPAANPDHVLDLRDWVRAGQLVAHLEATEGQDDFNKIDCAPRDSDGNGVLSVADWVQVGRYAVGLDPVTVVGSQKGKKSSVVRKLAVSPKVSGTRTLTVGATNLNAGASVSLPVVLNALGNENAVGFSVSFDPAQMRLVSILSGSGVGNASFNVNTNGAAQGQAGVALALSTGASLGAGLQQVAVLNFVAGPKAGGVTAVTLSDTVVQREVVDATAQTLALVSANGSANINPPPFLNIVTTGSTVQLSWSLAYSNLMLETLSDLGTGGWTGGLGTPTVSGTNLFLTLPLTNPHQMFRLGQ